MLAKEVVNKLSNSLAVVKKTWLHWELSEEQVPGRNSSAQAEEKVEKLDDTFSEVEAKVLADTQS